MELQFFRKEAVFTDKTAVGKFIAEQRKLRSLTQKQFADKLGVTDKAVSRWETGRVCTVTCTSTGDAVIHAYAVEKGGLPILNTDGERITDSQHISGDANPWYVRVTSITRTCPKTGLFSAFSGFALERR
ncbi:MAG: helix-turn-helix transcriptional regulator [Clostridia bacterium]|nr:helix-turn-helix transcriptional regulator [Clostridia bacterium]